MRGLLTPRDHRRRGAFLAGTALAVTGIAAGPMMMARADDQQAGRPPVAPAEFSARVLHGVQIYTCKAGTDGQGSFAPPSTPEARLERGIHHFAGPKWHAPDGSEVKGVVKTVIPRPGTIPELELAATSTGGPGLLAGVHTIRRMNTEGGVPPTTPCSPGTTIYVPYSATYVFQQ